MNKFLHQPHYIQFEFSPFIVPIYHLSQTQVELFFFNYDT